MRRIIPAFAAVVLATSLSTAASADFATSFADCERLARGPEEPGSNGAGVPADKIDSIAAVQACTLASRYSTGATDPRVLYRLQRAYWAAGPAQNIGMGSDQSRWIWGSASRPETGALLGAESAAWYLAQAQAAFEPETYLPAAEAGDADAAMKLYYLYRNQMGLHPNPAAAARWFDAALAAGHREAKLVAAKQRGEAASTPDDQKAVAREVYEVATAGSAPAQWEMFRLYKEGRGVPKDDVQANVWVRLAAANGDDDARLYLEKREKRELSTGEIVVLLGAALVAAGAISGPDGATASSSGYPVDTSCGYAMTWDDNSRSCIPDWTAWAE